MGYSISLFAIGLGAFLACKPCQPAKPQAPPAEEFVTVVAEPKYYVSGAIEGKECNSSKNRTPNGCGGWMALSLRLFALLSMLARSSECTMTVSLLPVIHTRFGKWDAAMSSEFQRIILGSYLSAPAACTARARCFRNRADRSLKSMDLMRINEP